MLHAVLTTGAVRKCSTHESSSRPLHVTVVPQSWRFLEKKSWHTNNNNSFFSCCPWSWHLATLVILRRTAGQRLICATRQRRYMRLGLFARQAEVDQKEEEEPSPPQVRRASIGDSTFCEQVIPALRWFKDLFGHLNVGPSFCLPDDGAVPESIRGFKLGPTVCRIQSRSTYVKGRPQRRLLLEELGFVWDRQDFVFTSQLLPALKIYRKQFGHLDIPSSFVMPESQEVPDLLQGFKLGQLVTRIRSTRVLVKDNSERVEVLDELGFVWNSEEFFFEEKVIPAMRWFKDLFGHLNVGDSFCLPDDGAVPESIRGVKLGQTVGHIRSHCTFVKGRTSRRLLLEELGFVWDRQDFVFTNQLLPALNIYREQYGHLDIPSSFAMPSSQDVPDLLRKFKLGQMVKKIRSTRFLVKDHSERQEVLDDLGFVWNSEEFIFEEQVLAALDWYRCEFGNLLVPSLFVVPESDDVLHVFRGLNLGSAVNRIRSHNTYIEGRPDRRKLLDELGFIWDVPGFIFDHQILPSLQWFINSFGFLCDVPTSFVVPDSSELPALLRGFKLGKICQDIRLKQTWLKGHPVRQKALLELISSHDPLQDCTYQKGTWEMIFKEQLLPAIILYKDWFGHLGVPADFAMPDGEDLQVMLRGFKLGQLVQQIRSVKCLVQDELGRLQALDELGFVWKKPRRTK
ncbi:unnamed protein product [Polarella glacialis]|uniref:Helicase-associated domain-containing protein n=1 Tax=Polarella glacialis TaxID=89957 RepID=A0A813GGT5_POLGL|nr:unnamed protein product [Polarella glacialis]